MRQILKRIATVPLVLLAALFLIWEEWLWEALKRITARIALWPPLARLEAWVARRSPIETIALFLALGAPLFPIKLGALWLIGEGHIVAGFALLVVAKVLGTAITARFYVIAKPKLMEFSWYAYCYRTITRLTAWAHARLAELALWQALLRAKRACRAYFFASKTGILISRFKAIRRKRRMQQRRAR